VLGMPGPGSPPIVVANCHETPSLMLPRTSASTSTLRIVTGFCGEKTAIESCATSYPGCMSTPMNEGALSANPTSLDPALGE
jgi:hypothetical protein